VLAVHVSTGDVHDVGGRAVYAVAATVPSSAVILAHNHVARASTEGVRRDISMTREVTAMLDSISVPLVDHIVVEGQVARSLRESGVIR
jgi:DNA repair protein RadC